MSESLISKGDASQEKNRHAMETTRRVSATVAATLADESEAEVLEPRSRKKIKCEQVRTMINEKKKKSNKETETR